MQKVMLLLQPFESGEDAQRVADDIRNRGTVSYVDAEGSTVNVDVGGVTVEDITVEGDVSKI
jgi:hypothetical protein